MQICPISSFKPKPPNTQNSNRAPQLSGIAIRPIDLHWVPSKGRLMLKKLTGSNTHLDREGLFVVELRKAIPCRVKFRMMYESYPNNEKSDGRDRHVT